MLKRLPFAIHHQQDCLESIEHFGFLISSRSLGKKTLHQTFSTVHFCRYNLHFSLWPSQVKNAILQDVLLTQYGLQTTLIMSHLKQTPVD